MYYSFNGPLDEWVTISIKVSKYSITITQVAMHFGCTELIQSGHTTSQLLDSRKCSLHNLFFIIILYLLL